MSLPYLPPILSHGDGLLIALKKILGSYHDRSVVNRRGAVGIETLETRVLMAGNPTATLSGNTITSTTAVETVKAVYKDSKGITLGSIDTGDLSVRTPSGRALTVSAVTTKTNKAGTTVTAMYTVNAPAGAWNAGDDGTYTVSLIDGQVVDKGDGSIPPASGNFTVAIEDTSAPTAHINAPPLNRFGATTYRFTVVYSDDVAVNAATINTSDVTVTGPAGVGPLSVMSATASSGSAKVVTATYIFAAPDGAFTVADNGTYTIALRPRQVTDTSSNAVPAQTTTFEVSVVFDNTPPTATLSVGGITDSSGSGATSTTVTAVYTDNVGLATDFTTSNVSVTGPNGAALNVSNLIVDNSSATSATVRYVVDAPGGKFDSSDNGNYTVSLVDGQIRDTSGNAAASTQTTFNVNITPPDTTPPQAAPAAFNITASGVPEVVRVIYTDNRGVNAETIGADDLSVTGPAGTLAVTSETASTSSNSPTITATYTLAIPNSAWTSADDGSYTVTVVGGAVRDTSNNALIATSTVFAVNIAVGDPSDPTFARGSSSTTAVVGEAAVVAPGGKIYVAGERAVSGGTQGVIERLNSDGSLDATFGSSGIVTTSATTDGWFALTMQGTDHLVAAGTSGGDFAVERFDLAGNVDSSFNANTGKATADFGSDADLARAVAIAPDGGIIAAGDASGHFAFARFSADGVLDTTFGQAGRQIFQVGTGTDMLGSMVVQSDGRIVGVGTSGGNVAVVRAKADGSPDSSFSTDGEITLTSLATRTDATAPDTSEGVALELDGKIVVANHTSDGHFGVVRLSTDGSIDNTFGSNGLATANFGGDDDADSIVVQPGGQILVAGTSVVGSDARTAVAAFDTNGNLIPGFGQGGLATLGSTTVPVATPLEVHVGDIVLRSFATAQSSDGRLIVGTSNAAAGSQTSQLRRLVVPGSVSNIPTQTPGGTSLGSFGTVNGKKNVRLNVAGPGGEITTFALTNATGMAYQTGATVRLAISSVTGSGGAALTITAKGGTRRVALGDVNVAGSLARMSAPTTDLSGTFYVAGALRTAALGIITGNLAVAGAIGHVTAAALTNGRIFSGTNLGADNLFSGDDTFTGGSIASIRINGAITSGLIAAGLDPGTDATYLTSDDTIVGGIASVIKSIYARSADSNSQFVAGAFKHGALPKAVKAISADPRFLTT